MPSWQKLVRGLCGCLDVEWKSALSFEAETAVDGEQVVIDADLGAGLEAGHGDHLGEHSSQAAMDDSTREIHEVTHLQRMALQEAVEVRLGYLFRLRDLACKPAGHDARAGESHLYNNQGE